MDWGSAVAVGVPALVAAAGILIGYLNSIRSARRKDRLERINRQLSELYGPLLALVSASSAAWTAFRRRYRPGVGFWDQNPEPPSPEEEDAWRLWMTEVFMPLNSRMEELVVSKADLLESEAIPPCLLELVAHVASYRATIASWANGSTVENKALINFPGPDLHRYAREMFARLKGQQQELLGLMSSDDSVSAETLDESAPLAAPVHLLIAGDARTGKTHSLQELVSRLDPDGSTVTRVRRPPSA